MEMVNVTLLRLFVLAVILVSCAHLFLIVRYLLWPRIRRITHCPWCWRDAGIAQDFPAPWSSTICAYHERRLQEQARARRLIRQRSAAAPTRPAGAIHPVEEVLA